jgi:hypothetical protein
MSLFLITIFLFFNGLYIAMRNQKIILIEDYYQKIFEGIGSIDIPKSIKEIEKSLRNTEYSAMFLDHNLNLLKTEKTGAEIFCELREEKFGWINQEIDVYTISDMNIINYIPLNLRKNPPRELYLKTPIIVNQKNKNKEIYSVSKLQGNLFRDFLIYWLKENNYKI